MKVNWGKIGAGLKKALNLATILARVGVIKGKAGQILDQGKSAGLWNKKS